MSQLEAINPRSGAIDYRIAEDDPSAVAQIAARLRGNQSGWAADIDARMAAMAAWADELGSRRDAMGAALTADTGRRLMSYLEVDLMVGRIRHWVERTPQLLAEPAEGRSASAANVAYQHQRVPYDLVGVISPWNFPLTLSLTDSVPALCAGCAVLLKPSEITPRFVSVLNDSIDAVPALAAVFRAVVGSAQTGSALIDNVDMLCFTGSVATGRRVAVQAAENFIPACLELGGKDPAVVLADADLDAAADALLRSAAGSTGQACMSIERIYIHESIFAELRERLVEKANALDLNTPDIHCGVMPPFIDQRQAGKVAAQLDDAVAKGAEVHSGGAPENIDGGWWMRPTVLSGITDEMVLMQEETFGPLLPLIPFSSDAEAVALANSGDFGLSGSVFGEEKHALAVARQLRAGAIGINDASMTALIHDIEKQSFGLSGMGPSRMGDTGLLRFLRVKAMMIQRDPPTPLAALDESLLPR